MSGAALWAQQKDLLSYGIEILWASQSTLLGNFHLLFHILKYFGKPALSKLMTTSIYKRMRLLLPDLSIQPRFTGQKVFYLMFSPGQHLL